MSTPNISRTALGVSIIALALSLFAVFSIVSIEGDQQPDRTPSPIRAAVVPAPPVSIFDAGSGRAEGHAVDIVERIANKSGIEVDFVAGNWATAGASLSSQQVDMVIGPIFMSEDRAREFAFSIPIYRFSVVPVVRANSPLRSRDDLMGEGVRVAVGRGGFDAQFVASNMPNATVSEFPPDDPNLSMLEVQAGRADLAIVDFATAVRFADENPGVTVLSDISLSEQYAGFMYEYGDERVRDFFDVAIRNMFISGEMSALEQRYAEERIWYSLVEPE